MLIDYYNEMTNTHKGILLMFTGFILLAYQRGWVFLDGLRGIIEVSVMVIAIAMIVYGFYKIDGPKKIMALINKAQKK